MSSVDIIKNMIFSILTEEVPLDSASDIWKSAKDNIKKCPSVSFETFYRHFWLSKYSLSTDNKLVSKFKKYVPSTISDYTDFLKELKEASEDYYSITNPDLSVWSQPEDLSIYESLLAFNIFNVSQIRSFLLSLIDARRRDVISHRNYKKAFSFLEHYHFIFTAVCSTRPSGLENKYSAYARKLRECTKKEDSAECINGLIDSLTRATPAYDTFEDNFKKIIYTSTQEKHKKLVQYILRKLDVFFSTNELKPNSLTIEHILPESSHNSKVGMIGNLLPLGEKLNSELQDKPFSIKLEKYKTSQFATVGKFVEQYSNIENWTEEDIEQRTKDIAKILYENIITG